MTAIPGRGEPIVDADGRLTRAWMGWVQAINRASGVSSAADVAAIATALGSPDGTVANIPDQDTLAGVIYGRDGITVTGKLGQTPAYVRLNATADLIAYDNTTSGLTAEDVQAALDELAAGGGLTDTDALPEGTTNLYYTDERVRDAVGTALVAGSNVTITVNDIGDTITIAATGGGSSGTPPLAANFTPFGTGLTVTDKSDRMQLIVADGTVLRGITQASIAPPYTIRAHLQPCGLPFTSDSFWAGIALSNGTAYRAFYAGGANSGTNVPALRFAIDAWNSSTSFNSAVANMGLLINPSDFWLEINDSGTTRNYGVSGNGNDWVQVFSEATNTGLTPTTFGIVSYNHANSSIAAKIAVLDWSVTASVLGDAA